MDRLGLNEDELCRVLGVDPLRVIAGDLDDKPQLPILLALTEEAAERVGEDLLRRWVRASGPRGRPVEHLLAGDFPAFEDDLATLSERGFVLRGSGAPRAPAEPSGAGAAAGASVDAAAASRADAPAPAPAPPPPPGGSVRIRRVRATEARALRDVRLRALGDEPLAFGSTHAREAAYPDDLWAARARESADGPRQATFFSTGERDDAPLGMAFTVIDTDDSALAHLFAMWVAPEARGTGAGAALVAAVVQWATAHGARTLRTAVTVGNDAAARLYERAGFRDTGVREPLGHSDGVTALLERRLGG